MSDSDAHPVRFWKTAAISTAVFSVLAFLFSATIASVWAQGFTGKVGPNVRVGSVDVSGLDAGTSRERIQQAVDARLANGITITFNGKDSTVPLTALNGNGDTTEYATFDVDAAVASALALDRSRNPALDVALLLKRRFLSSPAVIPVPITMNTDALSSVVKSAFPDSDQPVAETRFQFSHDRSGWSATVIEGHGGRSLDLGAFWPRVDDSLKNLDASPVALTLTKDEPVVTKEEASLVQPDAVAALTRGPYRLTERPDGSGRTWNVSTDELTRLIVPQKVDGRVVLGLDDKAFDAFITPVADAVEIAPQNARFQISGGKVTRFETSKTGVALDRAAMKVALASALFDNGAPDIALSLVDAPPDVTTEKGNDLGIVQELGVGTSNFKNSPVNRIKNIKNGARLLNGLLIAPGENFSLLNALGPFDEDNGYLPELVIKGDKIEPELGGGLCQIGTTTFRAVMNAGLPITMRQNHSLVVSYYNDPGNGNPGTDATIYDPAPDFKFTNDTGHYLLLQTEVNEATSTLSFHFWGTSDGRKGSYVPPTVVRWIPYGDEVDTPSPDLPLGTKKCQNAHVGADTSFVYTVTKSDGTKTDREFDSHYRPLPKICLVGTGPANTVAPASIETGGDTAH